MGSFSGGATALAAAVVALAVGTGCGSGGGGGADAIGVRANRSSVALVGDEHAPLLEERVTFTLTGTPNQPVHVGAAFQGEGLSYVDLLLHSQSAELRVVADTGLAPGTYAGTITAVACWDAQCLRHLAGSPVRIPYTVTLRAVPALVRPPDQVLLVDAATVPAQLQAGVPVALNVGPPRPWVASTAASWLVLDTPSGQTGEALAWHVDLTALAALPAGSDQVATVTVDAAGPLSTSFQVTLQNRLPEVRFVGPGALLAGRAGRAWIRGAGFDAVSDLALASMVEGLAGAVVSRVNDTTARLDVPAAPAGGYPVRLSNALGVPRHASAVRLVDPVTYPAAVLPFSGEKGGLLHDPVRQALYWANITDRTVHRLRYAAGAWAETSRAVAGVFELGLAPDASALVAAAADGTVSLLDPDTLEVLAVARAPGGLHTDSRRLGLPVTNDGRVWLTVGGGGWNQVWTLDLTTRALERPAFAVSTSFYSGPWSSVSRDGERLLMVQSSSISPQPPMLWLDASEGVFHVNQAGLTFWYEASQSETGRRAILHSRNVVDRDFAPVGTVALPADTMARAAILSPDGDRAYLLVAPYYPSFPGTLPARVMVYDTSTPVAAGTGLPVVGAPLAIPHDVTCEVEQCYGRASGVIAPDGKTLFLLGDERLLVVPLP